MEWKIRNVKQPNTLKKKKRLNKYILIIVLYCNNMKKYTE